MKIGYDPKNNTLVLADLGGYYEIFRSIGTLKWVKQRKTLEGPADLATLDRIAQLVKLPPTLAALRTELAKQQATIDSMRNDEEPKPIIPPPVKATLFKHQVRGYNMALTRFGLLGGAHGRGFGELFEMGCGKTLTAIAIAGALYNRGEINRLLIVCPTSITAVWANDMRQFAAFKFQAAVLQGEKKKRLNALMELEEIVLDSCLRVAIINYESTFRDGIFEGLLDYAPDMIICDESQRIKNHTAAQSKAMHRLGDRARFKLILSGTPIQNNAVDLYSQYRFMDPTVFGTNFYAFRNRYCMMGGFQKKQIIGYRDLDDMIRREHSVAYRVTKAECLDLPEQVFSNRTVMLSPKERNVYDKLKRDSYLELASGDSVTATTILTKILRLQQLTGGFLITDDQKKPQPANTAKLDALADILDDYVLESGEKIVIFARFRAELDAIQTLLQKKGIRYGFINGDVPQEDRGGIVADFQENPETMAFVAQIATAGLGITLTAASLTVFYSVGYNYAEYEQATARTHRIGQQLSCTYIHLVVEDSIDDKVLKALNEKQDIAHGIVDTWREFF